MRLMLVGLLVLPQALAPAVITATCSLREAINNANSNSDTSGGDCVAGDDLPSGGDTIALTTDVTLTSVDNSFNNGLPVITSDVTIAGGGYTIARAEKLTSDEVLFYDTG